MYVVGNGGDAPRGRGRTPGEEELSGRGSTTTGPVRDKAPRLSGRPASYRADTHFIILSVNTSV